MIRTGGGRRASFRRGLRNHLIRAGLLGFRQRLGSKVGDMLHQGSVEGGYRAKAKLIAAGKGNHRTVGRPGKEEA